MVAPFYIQLKWCEFPRVPHHVTRSRPPDHNRCIRICGAAFETQLFQLALSTEWENVDIMVKELASTVLNYIV